MNITRQQLEKIIREALLVEKNKGLWANIHAKKKRGEKSDPKSKSYKAAKKAGKKINERGTGNPALQPEERAIMDAVVAFVDKYRLANSMDPNDFGDDKRVRLAVQDVIATVLGEDM